MYFKLAVVPEPVIQTRCDRKGPVSNLFYTATCTGQGSSDIALQSGDRRGSIILQQLDGGVIKKRASKQTRRDKLMN